MDAPTNKVVTSNVENMMISGKVGWSSQKNVSKLTVVFVARFGRAALLVTTSLATAVAVADGGRCHRATVVVNMCCQGNVFVVV